MKFAGFVLETTTNRRQKQPPGRSGGQPANLTRKENKMEKLPQPKLEIRCTEQQDEGGMYYWVNICIQDEYGHGVFTITRARTRPKALDMAAGVVENLQAQLKAKMK